jgi:hypothetical protein
MGVLALTVVVFVTLLSRTGQYNPVVPPPQPLPVPNGFDDYVGAGKLLKSSGIMKRVEDLQSKISDAHSAIASSQSVQPPLPQGTANTASSDHPVLGSPTKTVMIPLAKLEGQLIEAKHAVAVNGQQVLQLLRAGFPKDCRVPAARSFSDYFTYGADCRNIARFLVVAAEDASRRGDQGEAVRLCLDGFELGSDVMRGGCLVPGLVGIAVQDMVTPPFVNAIEKLNRAECTHIANQFEAILLGRVSAADVMLEERHMAMGGWVEIDRVLATGSQREIQEKVLGNQSSDDYQGFPTPWGEVDSFAGKLAWRLGRDHGFRQLEAANDWNIQASKVPASRRVPPPTATNWIAVRYSGVFSGALHKFDSLDARNRLILCALRIREYRLTRGRLPARLANLKIDPSLLIDPFTGGILIYNPNGNDYLLYSVGADFKDDGGVPANDRDYSTPSPKGDFGLQRFEYSAQGSTQSRWYRQVPHMKKPNLPAGAPSLNPPKLPALIKIRQQQRIPI